ncbi:pumilio RNA-binding family [Pancytospora philotis]|nr:pumilio RNA-binding family [Pancytospora philotis]
MAYNRCYSAPPVDKFVLEDDVELEDIQHELGYTSYFRKPKDPRMTPPKYLFEAQGLHWVPRQSDFILKAFSEKKTGVEMIDLDYPESDGCTEFFGKSRTTTPVGDKPMVKPDQLQTSSTNSTVLIPIMVSSLQRPDAHPFVGEIRAFYETMGAEPSSDPKAICVAVCKDQDGSRFIQGKLEVWSAEQTSFFFLQICEAALELSTNLFGNYVIQKIIPYLKEEEAFKLIVQFFGQIFDLSLHVYGCRVIQKLIDNLDDIKFIVSELEVHILDLIASPNGNHVIQKCIDKDIEKDFLLQEFESNCIFLAQQRYGCRVLQRLFEVCTEQETQKIYATIIANIEALINDKYGNYVIQHLIQSEHYSRKEIFDYIIGNSFELSKYKFSSNVIEKCVNKSSDAQLEEFLDKFLAFDDGKRPNLFYMCTDMYANYVVQRFFDIADAEIKAKAKNAIKPYLKEMKAIPFTKHILARLS